MLSWADVALTTRMRQGWCGGLRHGTSCGGGSTPENTKNIRETLPALLRLHGIQSVCDAGAGDLSWSLETFTGFDYRAFDLVRWHKDVTVLDITKQDLPQCDAILCRTVLIHLDPPRILAALERFKRVAKYLLASQYEVTNVFDPGKQFNRTNLRIEPYALGAPLIELHDLEGDAATLAMWRLRC